MSELQHFFDEIVPFLRGEIDEAELEKRLGPSASGSRRLAFYRVLMQRDVALILRQLFPATRALISRVKPGLWVSWVEEYTRAHPAHHYEPNQFGAHFPDFVSERRESAERPGRRRGGCGLRVDRVERWHRTRRDAVRSSGARSNVISPRISPRRFDVRSCDSAECEHPLARGAADEAHRPPLPRDGAGRRVLPDGSRAPGDFPPTGRRASRKPRRGGRARRRRPRSSGRAALSQRLREPWQSRYDKTEKRREQDPSQMEREQVRVCRVNRTVNVQRSMSSQRPRPARGGEG